MIEENDYRLICVFGACLLLIGGGLLPILLSSPPMVYTNTAEEIDGDDKLSPSILQSTEGQKDNITSVERVSGYEREKLQDTVSNPGNWISIKRDPFAQFNYEYVIYDNRVYEVTKNHTTPAIKAMEIRGEEKLDVISVRVNDFPDRDYFGIRRPNTEYEVVLHTIEKEEYDSFTYVNNNDVIIDYEGGYYKFAAEVRQNSYIIIGWSFLIVFSSVSLIFGIALILYPILHYLVR